MALSPQEAERIARAGAAALQAGDPKSARAGFEQLVAAGAATAQVWLLLAHACRGTGDAAAEEAAVDQLLARDPRHLAGLILKGDCLSRRGDERGATSFYQAAITGAGQAGPLPPAWQAEIRRIEGLVARAGGNYQHHLQSHLAAAGFDPESVSGRFSQSIDILLQKKQVYFQQPSAYYFPELPQRQFYERDDFPWLAGIEAATDAIRAELLAVLAGEQGFKPYVQPEPDRPHDDFHGLLGNPDWSAFYLIEDGTTVEANAARCPGTIAALAEAPLTQIPGRTPSVLFSLLRAGTRIPPHAGMLNSRLICHLPLIVPPGCALRVGNETRSWEVGTTLIFDDSMEHEAWNDSDQLRVVLLFDIWRPELSAKERSAVAAMFEAIDSFGPPSPAAP